MLRVCFIIVNYNEYQLTQKCVQSIEQLQIPLECDAPKIIIIDNASPNKSGEILKKIYEFKENICVILNKKNEGFSIANNIGFSYAKKVFLPNFIIAVNSDVIFIQKDFIVTMLKLYNEQPFWVAGPDIYVRDRYFHQNPILNVIDYPSVEQIEIMKKQLQNISTHVKKGDYFALKKYIKEKYRNTFMVRLYYAVKTKMQNNRPKTYNDVCLCGACIIFDQRYIDNKDYLFRPLTFLYMEEEILCLDLFLDGIKEVFLPQLEVEHLDCGSTFGNNLSFREFCDKKNQQMEQGIESANVYIHYLKEMHLDEM